MIIYGAHNVDDFESGTHIASPLKIIVHDEWDLTDERFDADIALLITKEVPFTRFIKPICIWADSSVARAKAGFIAGWGRSEIDGAEYEPIPKQLKVSIKDQENCFLDYHWLAKMSSNRTFCAGARDGSGPCHGKESSFSFRQC